MKTFHCDILEAFYIEAYETGGGQGIDRGTEQWSGEGAVEGAVCPLVSQVHRGFCG